VGKLDYLFKPKSVAIVGASEDPSKISSVIFSNLIEAKFEGEIYPVNPKYKELLGRKCYPDIASIGSIVDTVVIAIPSDAVMGVLEEAGKSKAKCAIIISAGFKEIGEVGIERERKLTEISRKYNIRILGPNCLGEIIPESGVNLSFAASHPIKGDIAFLSQSGAFCTAILDMSLERNLGFSHFVSFGNKVDINENDFLDEWLADPKVNVIGGYIEEIDDGQELIQIYKESEVKKPFVLLKPGESTQAVKAMASHTGSLSGSHQAFKTSMSEAGIIVAKDANHMFNLMMGFSWSKLPKGKRVAVVTNAGGPGIISTDAIINAGLEMAEISEDTKKLMAEQLPPNASLNNPIDVIGDALAERYRAPIDILLKDPNVDSILVVLTPQLVTQIEDTAKLIINSSKVSDKPIFAVFLGGKYISYGLQRLYDDHVPAYNDINQAVDVIADLARFYEVSQDTGIDYENLLQDLEKGNHKQFFDTISKGEIKVMPDVLAEEMAREIGLDLPKQILSKSYADAAKFSKELYPVVLKVPASVLTHKTERKAVVVGIKNQKMLEEAYYGLEKMLRTEFDVHEPEIWVQEQLTGHEMFIGVDRDGPSDVYTAKTNGFGHLLAFGLGGIYVEVLKDIGYSIVPSTADQITKALKKTKTFPIISGARGKNPYAVDKLVDAVLKVQKLVLLYPQIVGIDLNPVFLTEDRAICVDIKIYVMK
jgi:acetyl coenzyme A synthetase (ADP forming)-like protein